MTEVNYEKQGRDIMRTIFGVSGLISLVIGVLILVFPNRSGLAIMQVTAIMIAAWMLISGVVYLGLALFNKGIVGKDRALNGVLGALFLISGGIIAVNITPTATLLATLLAVVVGVMWIIEAVITFAALGSIKHKTWAVIYGIMGILAGLVMLFSPLLGAIALWILLGVSLTALGITQIIRALGIR